MQWDQLRNDFVVRSEGVKRKRDVDSKQEIEKEGVNWAFEVFVAVSIFADWSGNIWCAQYCGHGVWCVRLHVCQDRDRIFSSIVFFFFRHYGFFYRPPTLIWRKKTNEKHRKNPTLA